MNGEVVYDKERKKRSNVRADGRTNISISIGEKTIEMIENVMYALRRRGIMTDRSKIIEWCVLAALKDYYYEKLREEGLSVKERSRDDELRMRSVEEKLKIMEKKLGVGEYVW